MGFIGLKGFKLHWGSRVQGVQGLGFSEFSKIVILRKKRARIALLMRSLGPTAVKYELLTGLNSRKCFNLFVVKP